MDDTHRDALRKNWVFLTENLITEELLDHLLESIVLTQDMYDEIKAERTKKDKVQKFLFIFQRRGPTAFGKFLLALRNTEQGFIADKLVQTCNQNNNQQPMQI